MNKRWLIPVALLALALVAWLFFSPRDVSPPGAAPASAGDGLLDAGPPEGRLALENATPEARQDAGAIPAEVLLAMKQPAAPRVLPYRPARLLLYSSDEPALEPAGDDRAWALRRIIEVLQPERGEEVRIRELWRTHEDGRRFLWMMAEDRKSGPRMLDEAKVAQLDAAFQSDLLNKVLTTEQGVRLLAETGRGQP